ncbi:MAG: LPXTG cell wall anchor domain-containing protein, partial [Aeriscardovia sp.]|nr:LPXTG cell wall anchor domain-containing protein [Aeriscardovia sp.]
RNTPATGAKFTVSQTQGGKTVYLAPVESGGAFTGWSWQSSPYDFSEQNSDADFSFGGLQDGAYTVTEVDPATGATPSSLSFTSSLSYSSPEALSDVTDSLHLLSSSQGVVYNMVVPSSLPLTGGSWVLIISSAAVLLFAAGAVMFAVRKKRRA